MPGYETTNEAESNGGIPVRSGFGSKSGFSGSLIQGGQILWRSIPFYAENGLAYYHFNAPKAVRGEVVNFVPRRARAGRPRAKYTDMRVNKWEALLRWCGEQSSIVRMSV